MEAHSSFLLLELVNRRRSSGPPLWLDGAESPREHSARKTLSQFNDFWASPSLKAWKNNFWTSISFSYFDVPRCVGLIPRYRRVIMCWWQPWDGYYFDITAKWLWRRAGVFQYLQLAYFEARAEHMRDPFLPLLVFLKKNSWKFVETHMKPPPVLQHGHWSS